MGGKQNTSRRDFLGLGIGATFGTIKFERIMGDIFPRQQSNSQWPQFQFDAKNTGYHANAAGPKTNIHAVWTAQTDGNHVSSPVVFGDFLYVSSSDSYVYCFEKVSGTRVWRFNAGTFAAPPPAVSGEQVYFANVGEEDGTYFGGGMQRTDAVYGIDAITGGEQWAARAQNSGGYEGSMAVTVGNGSAHTGYTSPEFNVFNAENGEDEWGISMDVTPYGVPAVTSETVYFGAGELLKALAVGDGSQRWEYSVGAQMSSPTVGDGVVFLGAADGRVYSLNAANGRFNWVFETDDAVWSSPAVANNTVYFGCVDSRVYAVDAATGEQQWAFETEAPVTCSPAVADGIVYIKSHDGNMYGINAADGSEKWSFSISAGEDSETEYQTDQPYHVGLVDDAPAISNGVVFVSGPAGTVYALAEE